MATVPGKPGDGGIPKALQPTQADMLIAAGLINQQGIQAPDYDYTGAKAAGVQPDPTTGHMPDTFKLPNHITFSDESKYHGVDGNEGGHWTKLGEDRWSFTPGATNLKYHSMSELRDYFRRKESGNVLIDPRSR